MFKTLTARRLVKSSPPLGDVCTSETKLLNVVINTLLITLTRDAALTTITRERITSLHRQLQASLEAVDNALADDHAHVLQTDQL